MKDLKVEFKTLLTDFASLLKNQLSAENGDWSIKGFIDQYKNIYTISSDTKIISKILEIHIFPLIANFAQEAGYNIVLAEHQNYYPDLTFINSKNTDIKFAVDIKTTYRKNNGIASFTLGSHGSYFKERNKRKNIQFPYNQYSGHFCLGMIYTRNEVSISETKTYCVKELLQNEKTDNLSMNNICVDKLKSIASVIKDIDLFVAEKWKIAGDKQGSGNTANIGCSLTPEEIRGEKGVFSKLGENWFDEYWINYGAASIMKNGKPQKVTNIIEFLEFKGRLDLIELIQNER